MAYYTSGRAGVGMGMGMGAGVGVGMGMGMGVEIGIGIGKVWSSAGTDRVATSGEISSV
mgnify:CR=1 FL=1